MEIKESFRVNCPIQEVWEFIIDPHKIGSCLPSVQSIEVVDDTHYKAVVKQKVGFITATFQINTEVVERRRLTGCISPIRGRPSSERTGVCALRIRSP